MPRREPEPDFFALLEVLRRHGAEFIVVGGVSAVLEGSPTTTRLLDLVHRRTAENIERLLSALAELKAYYRHHPQPPTPNETHLVTDGHQLLMTPFGRLDLLGSIDEGSTYDDLLGDTRIVDVEGRPTRVLRLERYIEMKERAGRDKDKAVLPVLRATLRKKEKRG